MDLQTVRTAMLKRAGVFSSLGRWVKNWAGDVGAAISGSVDQPSATPQEIQAARERLQRYQRQQQQQQQQQQMPRPEQSSRPVGVPRRQPQPVRQQPSQTQPNNRRFAFAPVRINTHGNPDLADLIR